MAAVDRNLTFSTESNECLMSSHRAFGGKEHEVINNELSKIAINGPARKCKNKTGQVSQSMDTGEHIAPIRKQWNVQASSGALTTTNPIREIIETMNLAENPDKKVIPLSIGDPTIFGNLKPCPEILEALHEASALGKYFGYQTAAGMETARESVADYYHRCTGLRVKRQDVILASGCSHAIDLSICVLARSGANILIPRPGFPLYKTLTSVYGIKYKQYDLLADQNWCIDLKHLESLIDEQTAAIVINNPSNPCGSVFSKRHLLQVLDLAERHKLPIISDEIYDKFVFSPENYATAERENLGRNQASSNSTTKDVDSASMGPLPPRHQHRPHHHYVHHTTSELDGASDNNRKPKSVGVKLHSTLSNGLKARRQGAAGKLGSRHLCFPAANKGQQGCMAGGRQLMFGGPTLDHQVDNRESINGDEEDCQVDGYSESDYENYECLGDEESDTDENDDIDEQAEDQSGESDLDDGLAKHVPFRSLASLSKTVPILTCGGISKTCLIPGLRLGWIIVTDPQGVFDATVRNGLSRLTQRIMGPNSLVQGALHDILTRVPDSFYNRTMDFIFRNAKLCYEQLNQVPGLKPHMPQGSMYLMVRFESKSFPSIDGDLDFTSRLMNEQSVLVLPGKCFDFPNYFRLCLTVPTNVMEEALSRMAEFCQRHYVPRNGGQLNSQAVKSINKQQNLNGYSPLKRT